MKADYFVFREARSSSELEALFRLHYEVYQNSRLHFLTPQNKDGIHTDCYDLRSRHFGLFMNNTKPVGYERPVNGFLGSMHKEVLAIASKFPRFYERVTAMPKYPLPIMCYWPEVEIVQNFYNSVRAGGKTIAESTILAIEPSISSFQIARFIIESVIAINLFCIGFDYGIMVCTLGHARFYQRYGFHRLAGTADNIVNGVKGRCVIITKDDIPSQFRERIIKMAKAYERTGQICYNPYNLDQLYQPVSIAA